jgi:osmotically-inducible protein OsmY
MNSSHFKRLYLLFAALLCVLVVGCASTASREGTGEYIDDSVITTKVKYAIAQDPQLKVLEINVETFKGQVQLSGFVGSRAHIGRATEVARGIKGVKSVVNDLRLK